MSAETHRPVLLVDDDPDILDSLSELLRLQGFGVVTASNGAEALARAQERPPCIILLDLMMPVMSGKEFREAQKTDPHLSGVPTIVVTAKHLSRKEARDLAVAACLTKPIDLDRLLGFVSQYC